MKRKLIISGVLLAVLVIMFFAVFETLKAVILSFLYFIMTVLITGGQYV